MVDRSIVTSCGCAFEVTALHLSDFFHSRLFSFFFVSTQLHSFTCFQPTAQRLREKVAWPKIFASEKEWIANRVAQKSQHWNTNSPWFGSQ